MICPKSLTMYGKPYMTLYLLRWCFFAYSAALVKIIIDWLIKAALKMQYLTHELSTLLRIRGAIRHCWDCSCSVCRVNELEVPPQRPLRAHCGYRGKPWGQLVIKMKLLIFRKSTRHANACLCICAVLSKLINAGDLVQVCAHASSWRRRFFLRELTKWDTSQVIHCSPYAITRHS